MENKIKKGLEWYKDIDVDNYINYITKAKEEKYFSWANKGKKKNPFMWFMKDSDHIDNFKKVANQWLVFDWKHITLQSTWISFDYIALKNKMLLAYPESLIDLQLVYEWDEIDFWKESWKIAYNHKIANPFTRNEKDIIWWYCVIKNKRWEFLTTLTKQEIEKHRKVAKTDFIWKAWFAEMTQKTVIKKAVKIHFDDVYSEIIEMDNQENNLENPIDIKLSWKQEIDWIDEVEDLKKYWEKNRWKWKDFDKYVTIRRNSILETKKQNENT